jgi:hypothetical protein
MYELVRIGFGVGLCVACGCGGGRAGTRGDAAASGPVRFLVARDATLEIMEATPAGVRDDRYNGVTGELTWLSTEPPIYTIGTEKISVRHRGRELEALDGAMLRFAPR